MTGIVVPERYLIIDAGGSALKVLECKRTPAGPAITSMLEQATPGADRQTAKERGETIRTLLAVYQVEAAPAVLLVSPRELIIRTESYPDLDEKSLARTISVLLQKEDNLAPETVRIHHRILYQFEETNEDGKTQTLNRVMVAALRESALQELLEMAVAAGVEPAGVTAAPFALARWADHAGWLGTLDKGEILLILDFGQSQIHASFISNRGLEFCRASNLGGNELSQVVRALGGGASLSPDEVETQKFQLGALTERQLARLPEGDPRINAQKVLQIALRRIFQRVKLTVGHFFTQFRESTITTQILRRTLGIGGNFAVPGLAEFYADMHDSPAEPFPAEPLLDISQLDKETWDQRSVSFAAAAATAYVVQLTDHDLPDFASLPDPRKQKTAVENNQFKKILSRLPALQKIDQWVTYRVFFWAVIIQVLLFTGLSAWSWYTLAVHEDHCRQLITERKKLAAKPAVDRRAALKKDYLRLQAQREAAENLRYGTIPLDEWILELNNRVPEGVTIRSLELEPAAEYESGEWQLRLAGSAAVYARLVELMTALREWSPMRRIDVKRGEQAGDRVEFLYECRLAFDPADGVEK